MKKTTAKAPLEKKPARRHVVGKKSPSRSVRARSSSEPTIATVTYADEDVVLSALTDLVEVSVEIRELLMQIRDALVEGEEGESEEVDTIVIAEGDTSESSEEEF